MRKLILILLSICSVSLIFSQDVVNPYQNYSLIDPLLNPAGGMPEYNIPSTTGGLDYDFYSSVDFNPSPTASNYSIGAYIGEYMILFGQFPWFKNAPLNSLAKTYSIETVGFPFTMNCAFQPLGCADGSTVRNLEMPNDPLINDKWGANLWRVKSNIQTSFNGGFSEGADLISYAYFFTQPATGGQPFYPHTILKHTIQLRCGTSFNDPVIDEISFIYDHTRGRMREYPFLTQNIWNNSPNNYDVIFIPRIISKQQYGHAYGETFNDDIYIRGNTINYFPFQTGSTCNGVPFSSFGDLFYDGTDYLYSHPADYTLVSSLLYKSRFSNNLAGYNLDPSTGELIIQSGIKHDYFVQNNFDLNLINQSARTIYNSSEVTITTNDLIFPANYTFKTIRGNYPLETEVTNDMLIENGYNPLNCATCDLRLIPVRTDLTTESTTDAANFPLSTQPLTQHLYASRYYLKNTLNTYPKLTIENCVGLYDCTFDVWEGSTMVFTDYPAHYGIEDNSNTNTGNSRVKNRFKIQTLGGAVLRNLAPVQYLQNGNIIQPTPLHYTATQAIYAGGHLTDPDADINALSVNQDYVVQGGADVTLEANDVIYLKDGFSAMSGSTFTAKIASTTLASSGTCPDLTVNLRLAGTEKSSKKKSLQEGLQAYPNPTTGVLKLVNNNRPVMAQQITITDTFGRTVFEKTNFNSLHDVIDFSTQPNGVYIAKVVNDGSSKPLRFVVNH